VPADLTWPAGPETPASRRAGNVDEPRIDVEIVPTEALTFSEHSLENDDLALDDRDTRLTCVQPLGVRDSRSANARVE